MMRYLCVLVLVLGCGKAKQPDQSRLTPDEEKVKKHILSRAHDPDSIEFQEWGPDLTHQEIIDLQSRPDFRFRFETPEFIVRVAYRARNKSGAMEFHDEQYLLIDGVMMNPQKNPFGAGWKDQLLGKN